VTSPDIELRRVWRGVAGPRHTHVVDALLERHREPLRRYHTAVHVMWVCRHVHELAVVHPVDDLPAVLAAALFHDAVYVPTSGTNEADSASLAVHELTDMGWDPDRCAAVAELIIATADHRPTSSAAEVLLDADLAILGAQANEYLPYAVAVRAEYAHVPDDGWVTGRAAVLRQFLDRPVIFHTSTMRAAREHRARANLAAELATLRGA
jgi:predicted metal-dependent HD superfamily phosphohydrolase